MEGPSTSILRILNNLAGHRHFFDAGVQSGNIVFSIEDRPRRIFPEWYSGTISEKKVPAEDIRDENCTIVAFDMATKLLKIGNVMQMEGQEDLDFARYLSAVNKSRVRSCMTPCLPTGTPSLFLVER
jgi:hypothetical protein